MIRGTTPTATFKFKNSSGEYVDLSTYENYVTFRDSTGSQVTFENERITFNQDNSFSITLTQEETLKFCGIALKIQIKAKKDGVVIASNIIQTCLEEVLNEEKI